jgi:hypothetical protein
LWSEKKEKCEGARTDRRWKRRFVKGTVKETAITNHRPCAAVTPVLLESRRASEPCNTRNMPRMYAAK